MHTVSLVIETSEAMEKQGQQVTPLLAASVFSSVEWSQVPAWQKLWEMPSQHGTDGCAIKVTDGALNGGREAKKRGLEASYRTQRKLTLDLARHLNSPVIY